MIDNLFASPHKVPVILQAEKSECGLACLAMVAGYHGYKIDIATLRLRFGSSSRGVSLRNILDIADSLNLSSRGLRIELSALRELQLPAILHWGMTHYVVLVKTTRNHIIVHDPAVGQRKYTLAEARRFITGVAVELTPTTKFSKKVESTRTKLTDLFPRTRSFYHSAAQIILLSIVIQSFAIAGALYVQLIVDQALPRNDLGLLQLIAGGFLLVVVFRALSGIVRSYVAMYLSTQVGFQMAANVFQHLVALPTEYFERRHVGDVVSRFGSLGAIRKILTDDMISVFLDGTLAFLTLVVLMFYSVKLTLIVLTFVIVMSIVRFTTIPLYRKRQEEVLVADASQQSIFMESMRAIQAIKAYCSEGQRISVWKNKFAETVNAGIRLQRFSIGMTGFRTLLFGVENIVVLYFAAVLVMQGQLTLGMLMSFVFLKGHFGASVTELILKLVDIRLIRLHLDRVSDITETKREDETLALSHYRREITGDLRAKNVCYSYSEFEHSVLVGVSLEVSPGTLTIISGPSGSGKSTFLRILAGLLRPSSGEILVDGKPVGELGYREYRSRISVVLQSTQLLSGSLAENISMFDEYPDMERIQQAAKTAMVHEEIERMPMGYSSLIGDMGSIISAGQAQRVLIARAIYHQPRILLLDEAITNVDIDVERELLTHLRSTGITLILVTHRTNLYDSADAVYRMVDGNLQCVSDSCLRAEAS